MRQFAVLQRLGFWTLRRIDTRLLPEPARSQTSLPPHCVSITKPTRKNPDAAFY